MHRLFCGAQPGGCVLKVLLFSLCWLPKHGVEVLLDTPGGQHKSFISSHHHYQSGAGHLYLIRWPTPGNTEFPWRHPYVIITDGQPWPLWRGGNSGWGNTGRRRLSARFLSSGELWLSPSRANTSKACSGSQRLSTNYRGCKRGRSQLPSFHGGTSHRRIY